MMRRAVTRAVAIAAVASSLAPALAQQPFVYPSRGQSPQQTEMDKGQCHNWAVQQSGYDPANPPPAPPPPPMAPGPSGNEVARGLFGGGLLGAGIGAISGHAGEGAAIGALFGGIRRARMSEQQQQQQQQAYMQTQQSIQAQGMSNYRRAFAACLTGRGYTVN